MTVLRIVAALAVDESGRVLLVRKRGTEAFMQPGGKLEPGETPAQALVRELEEELAVTVTESELEHLGRFDEAAANEPDTSVDADVFAVRIPTDVEPHAELEELRWLAVEEFDDVVVAPLMVRHMVPILRSGGADAGIAWRS